MGRYLERVENLARYVNVHYYMALDAPTTIKQEFLRSSIFDMAGIPEDAPEIIKSPDTYHLFNYVILDDSNPISLKNYLLSARENARGARNVLSGELWESINSFYHEVNDAKLTNHDSDEIFSFTEKVIKNSLIIKSYIDNTLIHNEIWALIHLGLHLERAGQTTRILAAKFADIEKIRSKKNDGSYETYQCIALLRSTEAMDMSKIIYKSIPDMDCCLEFLIMNKDFPKSVTYNVMQVRECFYKLFDKSIHDYEKFDHELGRISSRYYYLSLPEIKRDTRAFLNRTLTMLYAVSSNLEKTYLTY